MEHQLVEHSKLLSHTSLLRWLIKLEVLNILTVEPPWDALFLQCQQVAKRLLLSEALKVIPSNQLNTFHSCSLSFKRMAKCVSLGDLVRRSVATRSQCTSNCCYTTITIQQFDASVRRRTITYCLTWLCLRNQVIVNIT